MLFCLSDYSSLTAKYYLMATGTVRARKKLEPALRDTNVVCSFYHVGVSVYGFTGNTRLKYTIFRYTNANKFSSSEKINRWVITG